MMLLIFLRSSMSFPSAASLLDTSSILLPVWTLKWKTDSVTLVSSVFHRDSSEPRWGARLRGPLGKSPAPISHAAQKPRREIDEDWSYLSSELFLRLLGERLDYLWQTPHSFSLRKTLLWATKGNHQCLIIPTEVTVMLSHFETHSQKRFFTPHVGGGIFWVPDYFDIHSSPDSKLSAHNECIIIPVRPPCEQRVHISKINRTPGYWVSQGMEHSWGLLMSENFQEKQHKISV